MSRPQYERPLHEVLCAGDKRLSAETLALMALRAIEREARFSAGRQIACTVAPEVKVWLDEAEFDWRKSLGDLIGLFWTLEAPAPGSVWAREKIDVRAL
jgi:hypothetical protein